MGNYNTKYNPVKVYSDYKEFELEDRRLLLYSSNISAQIAITLAKNKADIVS